MKKNKIFITKQEKQFNDIIKKSVNTTLINDDYMYEKYLEQLSSEF